MPDNLSIRQPQDAKRINVTQPHEMEYWTKTLNRTKQELRDAVDKVDNFADTVKSYLRNY